MARQFTTQPHFSFGEISPRLYGREDATPREAGARSLVNMFVAPQGGVYKRPGTKFLYGFGPATVHLEPFQISDTLSYLLAFTSSASGDPDLPHHMLVFAGDGSSGTPVATFNAPYNPVEAYEAKYAQTETANGMLFAAHPTGNHFLAYVTDTDLRWLELSYNEAGQFMYNDGEHLTLRMIRGPWLPLNFYGNFTLELNAQAIVFDYRIDVTGPATGGGAGTKYFIPGSFEGRYIEIGGEAFRLTGTTLQDPGNPANEWRSYIARWVPDPLSDLPLTFPSNGSQYYSYRPSAFHPGVGAYAVAYHQGRLWFGGSPEAPNMVWSSKSGDVFDWMDGAEASDGIIRAIGAGSRARVNWMTSTGRRLLIGTDNGEFAIENAEDSILTPLSARVVSVGSKGSSNVTPVAIDDDVTYVERGGNKLRQARYEFTADNIRSREQSLLSEHIPRIYGPVRQLTYSRLPDEFIFGRLDNGDVFGITYVPDQNVEAFHRHHFGGKVESFATVPAYNQNDKLFMVVDREATGRTLEVLAEPSVIDEPWRADYIARRSYLIESWHLDSAVQAVDGGDITFITVLNPTTIRITSAEIAAYQAALGAGTRYVYLRDIRGFRYAEETFDDDGHPIGLNHQNYLVAAVTSTTVDLTLPSAITGISNDYVSGGKWAMQLGLVVGLGHLSGQTVAVMGDGRRLDDAPVTLFENTGVILNPDAANVLVGLPYSVDIVTTELLPPVPQGTAQGKLTRVIGADIRTLNSGPFEVRGYDRFATWDWMPRSITGTDTNPLPDAATAFTRIEYIELDHITTPEAIIEFRQTEPWPLHILSVSPRIDRSAR